MSSVSWKRKSSIVTLPQESTHLVRQYANLRGLDGTSITSVEVLERVQKVAANCAATDNTIILEHKQRDHGSAEYRCLETGGFLVPTVGFHPWYKDKELRLERLRMATTEQQQMTFAMLDLGCGIGSDARKMLIDKFASHAVLVDRSDLYLRLGRELFGDADDDDKTASEPVCKQDHVAFCTVDIAAPLLQGEQDVVVERIQATLYEILPGSCSFDAVYAGKFFHCLETEAKFRLTLRRIRKLLRRKGVLFGVFGRHYQPAFECAGAKDFSRVCASEGFQVAMLKEGAAGATWFCAINK